MGCSILRSNKQPNSTGNKTIVIRSSNINSFKGTVVLRKIDVDIHIDTKITITYVGSNKIATAKIGRKRIGNHRRVS